MTVAELVRKYAYHHYDHTRKRYTLSSGQVSDEYLDVKALLLHPMAGRVLSLLAAERLASIEHDAVAGVETGGLLLARLVAGVGLRPALGVRKDSRSHGTTRHGVDGLDNVPDKPRVCLVEDVITTGASVAAAAEKLLTVPGLTLLGVLAVVDREQGGVAALQAALAPVKVLCMTTLTAVRAAVPKVL